MQFARVAARQGIVSRRQLASWGFEHLRYRLRGTTDERTGEVLRVARELITGVPARTIERMEPGGDGRDPAAGLPADAGRGPRPPGRRPADLHRQRRRQRHRRVAGPGAGDGGRHRHPLRGRRRRQLHRRPRRPLRLRPRQGRGDGGLRRRARIDLDASYAYSDSLSDLPMLRAVGNPVAVNPDPPLAELARRRAGRRCASSGSAAAWSRSG